MTTTDKSSSRTTAFDPKDVPPAESIRQQLSRILASPEFKATDVQKSFFTFVVKTWKQPVQKICSKVLADL